MQGGQGPVSDPEEAEKYHIENQQPVQGLVIGDGNIVHQYFGALHAVSPGHAALSPSSKPVWNVPFARNPFFTGREDLLEQLHTQLQTTQAAAVSQPQAISGLGGVGKTQLAIEYAYRYRQEYQEVLWARADTTEALNTSYTEIARLLQLPQQNAQEQEIIVQGVKNWLSNQQNWLLIMDNADDLSIIQIVLPTTFAGHLLLTTRAQAMGKLARRLEVGTMDREDGALLLMRRAGLVAQDAFLSLETASPADCALSHAITEELGDLPLALDQAGAYIEETGCGLADYQHLYQTRRMDLLRTRGGVSDDHPESVATTWSLSFEQVEQHNPAAADLLRLCAFLAPDAIPEELLTEGAGELGEAPAPIITDSYQLDQAIAALRAYSFITRDPQTRTLTVHRLIQAVLRDSMPIGEQQQWMQCAVRVVAVALPESSDLANWPVMERLLPHALTCAIWIDQTQLATPEAAHLLDQTGYYLKERARYEEAELFYQRALTIREQVLGAEHPDTAATLNNLGRLYTSQGKYQEAELFYQRALEIRERVLGTEHPDTATTLNNLGRLYTSQGKYQEAELFYQRALEIRERVLGTEHPDTAASCIHLGAFYASQGKYKQAEPFYQRALAIYEQTRGAEHLDTAASLNSLGTLYRSKGKYKKAEMLYQRALAIVEKIRGAEHPDTAGILTNLGGLYYSRRKYKKAEQLYQRALAIFERALGLDHPDMVIILTNLGGLYYSQGKYEKAEPLYQRALTVFERVSVTDHPDIARLLTNLGRLYSSQGKYEQAELLYQRALAIYDRIQGAEHPDKATTLIFYSVLLWKTQRKLKAVKLIPSISQIWVQQLSIKRSPSTE